MDNYDEIDDCVMEGGATPEDYEDYNNYENKQ
jgi:hypothetical protein